MRTFVLASAVACLATTPAFAETDLFSPATLSGLIDLRAALSKGERSWTEGGFGKTRFSGGADDFVGGGGASVDLMWQPRFSWNTKAVFDLAIQPDQVHAIEASEAYFAYKTGPSATWSGAGRIGYFYPPISLEHEGAAWSTIDTITPSAINSWVGEEVKVLGAEGTLNRRIGEQEVSATFGAFGADDTSGTLLTFRGWAMHDLRSTLDSTFPLPPLSTFMSYVQDPFTRSGLEIDQRVGFYGRAEYRPSQSSSVHVFYYDNSGDKTGVTGLQWAWDTEFLEAGTRFWLDENTKITAQAMSGSTVFGFPTPDGIWADVDFHSAFVSVTRKIGDDAVTLRGDWFDVVDQSLTTIDNNDENGWAVTSAYRHKINDSATLLVEGLHVYSDRPSRALAGLPDDGGDTTFQVALRLAI